MVLVLIAGCSSGSKDAATSATTSAPKLEPAVRAYTAAFLGGDDAAAYALLTARCQGEITAVAFERIVDEAHAEYGTARITSYTDRVDGASATATYELSDSSLNQTAERWVLEDGAWHNDDCG